MDRESAALMKSLDLEVAPSFYGPKTIDLYGQLRRADTSVVCKTVDVQGATVDYSNSAICMQNAEQHANVRSFLSLQDMVEFLRLSNFPFFFVCTNSVFEVRPSLPPLHAVIS